ncbi:sodium:calcium antiporter [Patescibacteria group bacterium]|nr:sodium:calcium antiporter [Patescibacteria group bacterium]
MILLYITVILVASIALVKSTQAIIKTMDYIAKYFHIPEFVIAFILAGIITSFPELFIGITSAINNTPVLGFSNVIGSNIADLTLILGLIIILARGIKYESRIISQNIIYTFILIIYPILLASDGLVSRIDGVGLLIIFILYNVILFFQSQDFSKTFSGARRKDLIKNIWILSISIIFIIISSSIIVKMSQILALKINASLFVVGLFLVAVATSLPELTLGIKLISEKRKEIIIGNILGSLAANSTAIIGIIAIISPIMIKTYKEFLSSVIFMIASYFIFVWFSKTDKGFTKKEGLILLLAYISFIIIQSLIK